MKVAFAQQARQFLKDGVTRKRNPWRPATERKYHEAVENHLIPLIGKLPLQTVGGKVLRDVVTKLAEKGLSPRTIGVNVFLVKKIRRSAVSEDGGVAFPYEWNSEVIDAPAIGTAKQPTIDAGRLQDAISKADMTGKALYALLGGTGLRIAEARAVKIGPDDGISTIWLPKESKVIVRQQMGRKGLAPTKTAAGVREIDLTPALNIYLTAVFIDWLTNSKEPNSLLFPDCESCYRERLKKDGITGGFHAFRRFRITHLRMSGAPQPLIDFWDGHAASTMSERYTQVAGEIESRKEWVVKVGLGFKLPEAE